MGSGGWDKLFDTFVSINRQWADMAHSEKLLDIIALGKCEVHFIKANIAFAL